jgi:hypothetical protein
VGCGDACPYVPTTVEAWDFPDPAGLSLERVRPIRDAIVARVRELCETRLEQIRSDTTAHRARLLPPLIEGSRTPGPRRRSGRAPTRPAAISRGCGIRQDIADHVLDLLKELL